MLINRNQKAKIEDYNKVVAEHRDDWKEDDVAGTLTKLDEIAREIFETKKDAPYKEFISDETWEK